MINYVWVCMMLFSLATAVFNGKTGVVIQACFEACEDCADLIIKVTVLMCFWKGILNIAKAIGLTEKLSLCLKPLLRFVLGKNADEKTADCVSSNITANIMGLGNAATPFGLAAMEKMDEKLKGDTASNEMCRFIILNTASIQLVPSTVFALRSASGSEDAFCVLVPIWICSALTLIFAMVLCKAFERKKESIS